MNYESIAKQVHDLVTKSKSMLPQEHGLPSVELKINEFAIIKRVFSEYEVSGDVVALETLPLGLWG